MKKAMIAATVISLFLTAVFTALPVFRFHWAVSFAITFGTFFYHFAMRLAVGSILNRIMRNRADYTKSWFQLRPFEKRFYKTLNVKNWKGKMPTYDPTLFDPKLHSWDEIAQATCQAELVHETIAILSFLPLLASIPFGSFGVFFLTSLISAMYDLCFVIMQRFNRPRIIKLINKTRAAK